MASSSYFDEQEPSEPFHCTICMTELPRWPSDACILQPCGHHFHLECATRWMDRESSCPNCKAGVTTIAKVSGRSKRRRSEIAVEPKRQSVAGAEDMELPDAETQLDAPPSEGYQRDGFVVGDDDVEFYSSEEERARVVRPRRGRAAAARANALIEEEQMRAEALLRRSGRLGRLRRHAQADSQPPSDSDDDEAEIAVPLPPLSRGRLRRNIQPESQSQSQEAPGFVSQSNERSLRRDSAVSFVDQPNTRAVAAAPESSPDDDDWDESQGEAEAAAPSQSQAWDTDEEAAFASPARGDDASSAAAPSPAPRSPSPMPEPSPSPSPPPRRRRRANNNAPAPSPPTQPAPVDEESPTPWMRVRRPPRPRRRAVTQPPASPASSPKPRFGQYVYVPSPEV